MTAPRSPLRFAWAVLATLALACASVAAAQGTSPKTAASGATTPAQPASASSAATASQPTSSKPTSAKSTRRATASGTGAKTKSKGSAQATAKSATPKDGASRRLTDVHIEGEMPVPQVLFITARDQRRYVDFQHQRYLRDSRALGAATATPTRVTAAGNDTPH
jgi:hypothetical protein